MENKSYNIRNYLKIGAAIAGMTVILGGCGISTGGEPFRMPEEPGRQTNRDPFSQGNRLQSITSEVTGETHSRSPRLPIYPDDKRIFTFELYRRKF